LWDLQRVYGVEVLADDIEIDDDDDDDDDCGGRCGAHASLLREQHAVVDD